MTTAFNPSLDPYDRVAQVLGQTSDQTRLKKLLLCACRNQWETDPQQLDQFNLASLLQELQEKNPTLKDLRLNLDRVIQGLSKPGPYTLLADSLVQELKVFYPAIPTNLDNPYEQVANKLSQHQSLLRIKKLLYCAVTDQWESDQNKLAALDLAVLLQEVQLLFPSLSDLQRSLNGIVKTLTKPDAYLIVANAIVAQCRALYQSEADEQTSFHVPDTSPEPTEVISAGDITQRVVSSGDIMNDATQALSELVTKFSTSMSGLNPSNNVGVQAPSFQEAPKPAPASAKPSASPPASEKDLEAYVQRVDLLQARREIMASTVPLRAKILIFSVTYQKFNFDANDWTVLRQHHLDSLLRELVYEFDQLTDLSTRLEIIARCLQEPDEYVHTATVICQALEPIYRHRPQLLMGTSGKRIFLNPDSISAAQSFANLSSRPSDAQLNQEVTLADCTEPGAGKARIDPNLEMTQDLTTPPPSINSPSGQDNEPTYDLSASPIAGSSPDPT